MSNTPQEAQLYLLYEDDNGDPRVHWQYFGEPRVPGCSRSPNGDLRPPPCRWVVRATSAKQACYFVHEQEFATSTGGIGILWDRSAMHLRTLPEENRTEYWAVLTCFGESGRDASPWFRHADAEEVKAILDERGCRGRCRGDHRLVQATRIEHEDEQAPDSSDARARQDNGEGGSQNDSRVKEPV